MKKSNARLQLDKDRGFILWLYDSKCVWCGAPTKTVHEIVPISHGKSTLLPKNRVPLCVRCHLLAHENTTRSIPILQDKRKQYLYRKFVTETV